MGLVIKRGRGKREVTMLRTIVLTLGGEGAAW
jgi:hypothetical protein